MAFPVHSAEAGNACSVKKTLVIRFAYCFLKVILFTAPVNDHVEAGLALVKRPEATRTAAEDDGHTVDHGLVEVTEAEARLLFAVKVGKQVDAFVERVDYYIFLLNKIVCGPNIERLSLMLKK